jgi:hypothetical protein
LIVTWIFSRFFWIFSTSNNIICGWWEIYFLFLNTCAYYSYNYFFLLWTLECQIWLLFFSLSCSLI